MAALDLPPAAESDEAEVEAEWRKIDRERRAQEIAAAGDAAQAFQRPMRRRWPWLALAGALAAGVFATVVINRPLDRAEREVALVTDPGKPLERDRNPAAGLAAPAAKTATKDLADRTLYREDRAAFAKAQERESSESSRPGDEAMDGVRGGLGGGGPAGAMASDRRAGRELVGAAELARAEKLAEERQVVEGKNLVEKAGQEALARRARTAADGKWAGQGQAAGGQDQAKNLPGQNAEQQVKLGMLPNAKALQRDADGDFAQPRLLTMRIRGPSDRERLATVLAASGVEVVSGGPALKTEVLRQAAQEPSGLADKGRLADEGQPAERFMQPPQRGGGGGGAPLAAAAGESAKKSDAALDAAADAGEAFVVDRESGAGREQIEVAGSSEAIAALIAALDAGRSNADADAELLKRKAANAAPAPKPGEAMPGDARSAEARLEAAEADSLAANGTSPSVRLTIVVIDETPAPSAAAVPAAPPADGRDRSP